MEITSEKKSCLPINGIIAFIFLLKMSEINSKSSICKLTNIKPLTAAAAKSLQLCPTLCNPIDGSPPRLPHPWDSPGKNTGVGCHFLLQCMRVKSEREVAQLCPTLSDPMDYSPPGSSIQAPPPMGFSRQEYWNGVPLPSQIRIADDC